MRFERLEIWRRSKDLSVAVYRELESLRDRGFRDQITRSMLSVPGNIAEGMEKKYHYLSISKGASAEFKTQTIIGKEIGYIKGTTADRWISEIEEISKMIAGFQRNLN